ncbi:Centromere protein J [Trichoplax sp. H2]|nr:Centromere protein J [Trichoplax sp. H2]|eukprot:RDD40002.1 Centromere protein J [Trichoplax sp. H2]
MQQSQQELLNQQQLEVPCKKHAGEQENYESTKDPTEIDTNLMDDERPIRPGIGQKAVKSFEELVASELQKQGYSDDPITHSPLKKPFLRKGEGSARFYNKKYRRPLKIKSNHLANTESNKDIKRVDGTIQVSPTKNSEISDSTERKILLQTQESIAKSITNEYVVDCADDNYDKAGLSSSMLNHLSFTLEKAWEEKRTMEEQELEEFVNLEEAIETMSVSSNISQALRQGFDCNSHEENKTKTEQVRNEKLISKGADEKKECTNMQMLEGPLGSLLQHLKSGKANDDELYLDEDDIVDNYNDTEERNDECGSKFSTDESYEYKEMEDNNANTFVDLKSSVQFGDDNSWNDKIDNTENSFLQFQSKAIKNSKNSNTNKSRNVPNMDSLLIFPELSSDVKGETTAEVNFSATHESSESLSSRSYNVSLIHDKVKQLNQLIGNHRFKLRLLDNEREEIAKVKETIKKERDDFLIWKSQEIKKFNDIKEDEIRKLRKQRRIYEQYRKDSKASFNKSENADKELLVQQKQILEDELINREKRWSASVARLRNRIDALEKQNQELRKEIVILERYRLKNCQNREFLHNQNNQIVMRKTKIYDHNEPTKVTTGSNFSTKWPEDEKMLSNNICDYKTLIDKLKNTPKCAVLESYEQEASETVAHIVNLTDNYKEVQHGNGIVERTFTDCSRVIYYSDGSSKEINADGTLSVNYLYNGDILKISPDKEVYYYAATKTHHTTFTDGRQILRFANNQAEIHYPNGMKIVVFPDKSIKYISPDGMEENYEKIESLESSHLEKSKLPDSTR